MEYILLLEEKKRYCILGLGIFLAVLFIYFSSVFFGLYGLILSAGLLFFTLITPLIYGKYRLFLYLWLLIYPFASIMQQKTAINIDFTTFFITGLTFPYAVILIYNSIRDVVKKFPFVSFLLLFEIILFLNILRPGGSIITTLQEVRFHFINIFLISVVYFYTKNNKDKLILNLINIYVVTNAIVALFQRLTGIGLMNIEGFARTPGLCGHPNALAGLLCFYAPMALYMYFTSTTSKSKKIWLISILLSLIALFFTLSKGALLIIIAVAIIFFINLPHKAKYKFLTISIIGTVLFLLFDYTFSLGILKSIIARFGNSTSLEWRYKIWNILISNINLKSLLLGYGTGSSEQYLMLMNPGESSHAHNGFIQLVYDYGILGLSYALAFVYLLIKTFKGMFNKVNLDYKYICMVIFTTSIIFLMKLYSDQALWERVATYYGWVIITLFYYKMILSTNPDINDNL